MINSWEAYRWEQLHVGCPISEPGGILPDDILNQGTYASFFSMTASQMRLLAR